MNCTDMSRNPARLFVFPQVTQLEELLAVRHSVFVVGGPGTGKSQVSFYVTTVSIEEA